MNRFAAWGGNAIRGVDLCHPAALVVITAGSIPLSLVLLVAIFSLSIFRVVQVSSFGCSSRLCTGSMNSIPLERVRVRLLRSPLFAMFEPLLRPCTENTAARAMRQLSGILCVDSISTVIVFAIQHIGFWPVEAPCIPPRRVAEGLKSTRPRAIIIERRTISHDNSSSPLRNSPRTQIRAATFQEYRTLRIATGFPTLKSHALRS